MKKEFGIPCPGCGRRTSRVINSRFNDATIRRRRLCSNCGGRFTTLEQTISFTPRQQVGRGNPNHKNARKVRYENPYRADEVR